MFACSICHIVDIFIDYCKTTDFFFWLIFRVGSPPSLTAMRFSHSLSMNTNLGESSQFSMSPVSILTSSSLAITKFFRRVAHLNKTVIFFENKTRKIKQGNICKRSLLDFISYRFVPLALSKKL